MANLRVIMPQFGKMRNSLSPKKKKKTIRQINSLEIYSVKPLLSRNFYQKYVRERIPVISTLFMRKFHCAALYKVKNLNT